MKGCQSAKVMKKSSSIAKMRGQAPSKSKNEDIDRSNEEEDLNYEDIVHSNAKMDKKKKEASTTAKKKPPAEQTNATQQTKQNDDQQFMKKKPKRPASNIRSSLSQRAEKINPDLYCYKSNKFYYDFMKIKDQPIKLLNQTVSTDGKVNKNYFILEQIMAKEL